LKTKISASRRKKRDIKTREAKKARSSAHDTADSADHVIQNTSTAISSVRHESCALYLFDLDFWKNIRCDGPKAFRQGKHRDLQKLEFVGILMRLEKFLKDFPQLRSTIDALKGKQSTVGFLTRF
jgi:hypothetical protein